MSVDFQSICERRAIASSPPVALLAPRLVERLDEVEPPHWQWRIAHGVGAAHTTPTWGARAKGAASPRHWLIRMPRTRRARGWGLQTWGARHWTRCECGITSLWIATARDSA